MRSPYAESNATVRAYAKAHRYRVTVLGDGEVVLRLRGAGGFASLEGPDLWGFYCPTARPQAAFRAAHGMAGTAENRSSGAEVYLRVSGADAALLLARGPKWARARRKRPAPVHLAPFQTAPAGVGNPRQDAGPARRDATGEAP